jgi:small conductance mechanosensitive channel
MEEFLSQVQGYGAEYGIRIAGSVAIFILGRWLAKIITKALRKLMERSKMDVTLSSFFGNVTYFALLVFVVIAAINNLGVNTTALVALLGAAGLAVGLALQGSLANFGAGVLLIIFKPFKVGDVIDASGALGTVEAITMFTTNLKTPDNKAVIIPNGNIVGGNIINYTAKEVRRIDLVFGVSYTDDLRAVRRELEALIAEDERILKDPEPFVGVTELADSSVNFLIRPWVRTADYWAVYFDMIEKVKVRFDEKGIAIPLPQRDVHLFQEQ